MGRAIGARPQELRWLIFVWVAILNACVQVRRVLDNRPIFEPPASQVQDGVARVSDGVNAYKLPPLLAVLPPATTTRAIDKLISLALVYRRVDPADRRRVMVFLSPHGSGALAAVDDRQRQIERDLATSVGSRRYLALGDSLAHLTR